MTKETKPSTRCTYEYQKIKDMALAMMVRLVKNNIRTGAEVKVAFEEITRLIAIMSTDKETTKQLMEEGKRYGESKQQ